MPDENVPEEELTPDELAYLAGPDADRGRQLASPSVPTPPPPPPGRAGASGTGTAAGTGEQSSTGSAPSSP